MRLRERLRRRWQILTGEEDTPFDGDVPAWLFSLLFHLCLLGLFMVFLHELQKEDPSVELISTIIEPDREEEAPRSFSFRSWRNRTSAQTVSIRSIWPMPPRKSNKTSQS